MSEVIKTKQLQNDDTKQRKLDPVKIYWEEFSLVLQEYFQALDRFRSDPHNPVKNQIF